MLLKWRFTVDARDCKSLVSQAPITSTFRITNADRKRFTKYGLLFCVDAHRDGIRFIVKTDDLFTAFLSVERDATAPKGANGNATRQNVA